MKKNNILLFSIFPLLFTSCNFSEMSTVGIFVLFGFLILCFIIMFFVIFKTQRSETKKMNQYVANVNKMLANCDTVEKKERELNILIKRIKEDPNYAKNEVWKNKVLAKTYLFLATLYYNKKDYNNTLDICSKILDLTPNDDSVLYNRGSLYLNAQDYTRAIEDFTACIELNDKNANAYNNRGLSYEKLDNDDKALRDYCMALDIEESAIIHLNIGNVYKKLNEREKAKEHYLKGLELSEDKKVKDILNNNLVSLK